MTDGPSVRRIKSEKRNMPVEPAPAGMSRRRFLTFLGTGSAALAARTAGLLPESQRGFPSVELRDEHRAGLPNAFARLEQAIEE